ncbi:hypothetical protein VTL71DRAFT_11489 [Oculimacula yallundae]|uniref:2EXR domain-containing protein n=1 Tax=Oculimacula yallundae TaxID=86028 RepID=A0ABR4CQC3_9HELO
MSNLTLPHRPLRGVITQANETTRPILPHRPLRVPARTNVTTRSASAQLAKDNETLISRGLKELSLEAGGVPLEQPGSEPQEEILAEEPGQFVRFIKLPAEIRMMIWRYFSPGSSSGRVVEVFHCLGRRRWGRGFRLDGTSTYKTNAQPPVMLGICKETRAEALKQSLCPLEDDAKTRIMFNPLSDAVYFRFQWTAEHFGFDKIRHLILDYAIAPEYLAQFVHLEVFTVILHEGFRGYPQCKTLRYQYKDYEKPAPPVVFYKPSTEARQSCEFQAQQRLMDDFKAKNPLWNMPVLNVLQTLVEGKPCCALIAYAQHPGQPRVQLQSSSFWDGYFGYRHPGGVRPRPWGAKW